MAPGGVVTVTTMVLCCCILGLLSSAPAAQAQRRAGCCMSYTRKPVSFHLLKDFTEQTDWQNCNRKAIIFYTLKRRICATMRDDWVRTAVARLRKLKELSKSRPAKGGAMKTRGGISSVNTGGGSVFSGTETLPHLSSRNQNLSASTETVTPTEADAISTYTETLY